MKRTVGIVGYGADVPRYRIKTAEIARAWGWDADGYRKGLGLEEKSVAARDQDAVTLSVVAGRRALSRAGIDRSASARSMSARSARSSEARSPPQAACG